MSIDERIQAILIQKLQHDMESILCFLNYRSNPNITNGFGMTLLHIVASAPLDNLEIVQYLLGLGANINVQTLTHRLTPLHLAVSWKNYKIVDFLITKGAAVDTKESSGKTALHFLIDDAWSLDQRREQEKQKTMRLLKKMLESGADPNVPDIYGETPLMRAVRQNDFDIVKQLLMFGGNVHLRNINSETSLHLLAWSFVPNKDILMELIKHKACVNCFGSQDKSVMDFVLQYYEAEEGLKTVKLLIKTATLVNWENKIFYELGTNHEFQCLEEFIDSCYAEVSRMKCFTYSDKSNLCHFALNGANVSPSEKSFLFDEVFETLLQNDFPIYEDFIEAHFDGTFLKEKLFEMNMYVKNRKGKVRLHYYAVSDIASYLSRQDLLNLIRAYVQPLNNSLNDKINLLTKC